MKTEGTPGPGTYESKGTNEFPLYGFGSNPRHGIDMPNKSYPGPGTYDENQDAVKNAPPRYGFGQRPEIIDKGVRSNPGPGNYDPSLSQTKNKDPAFKIGTGQR